MGVARKKFESERKHFEEKRAIGRPRKNTVVRITSSMDYIKKVDKLNMDGNIAENWRVFKQNYDIFCIAAEIDKKSEAVKIAVFLNAVGADAVEVFNSFNLNDQQKSKYVEVINAFDEFCKPKKNVVYDTFIFHSRQQKESEPFDNFLMDLKKLIRLCEFGESEKRMMRDRLVFGVFDKNLQKRMLEQDGLEYDKAVEMARASEASKFQTNEMQKNASCVDAIHKDRQSMYKVRPPQYHDLRYSKLQNTHAQSDVRRNTYEPKKMENLKYNTDNNKRDSCKYCASSHLYGQCRAYGKQCSKCGKANHFAVACRSKNVREIKKLDESDNDEEDDVDDDEDSFHIDSISGKFEFEKIQNKDNAWYQNVRIQDDNVVFKLDSGAEVNVLPFKYYKQIGNLKLIKSNTRLEAYGGSKLNILGETECICIVKNNKSLINFVVVDTKSVPLLGLNACLKLNLITRVDEISLNSKEKFLKKYSKCFDGLGCFVENFKIELKSDAVPVVKPPRRVALSLLEPLLKTLNDQVKREIIEKVDEPAEWVSNLVIVEKPNKSLRVCLDPQELNLVIKSDNYLIPTLEDLSINLAHKKIFTVLDLKDD